MEQCIGCKSEFNSFTFKSPNRRTGKIQQYSRNKESLYCRECLTTLSIECNEELK